MTTQDQGPVAAFRTTTTAGSRRVLFDATADFARDRQPLSRYAWDFGDGARALVTTARTSHRYTAPGPHTATLTVTDAEGCSLALVFHGQSANCNRDPKARVRHTVTTREPAACR